MGDPFVDHLVSSLRQRQEEFVRPFPYADCRALLRRSKGPYDDLIPDLNAWFYTIGAQVLGIERILSWPKAELEEAQQHLGRSFFVEHPEYKPLEPAITASETPDLYVDLALHEKARADLLALMSRLLELAPPG